LKLLASGREADIFDVGGGRVLRRYKHGGEPKREALVMELARAHRYPVPQVLEVRDNELVLERVDGPSMMADLQRRRWRLVSHARMLARLHTQLHRIEAPAQLPQASLAGSTLLHLDLHPLNVILSARGPVVIDWTNARRGAASLDPALTWVIAATSTARGAPPRGLERLLRAAFIRAFLAPFDLDVVKNALTAAAELRLADRNVPEAERAAVRRLVFRFGQR
jgi:tRNA A-37 threonylcarbamoyl transferase component Bud32